MANYNWGLIGTGEIAGEMADALQRENGSVYAVAARDEAKTKIFAAQHHVTNVYKNADELIADPQVDIVYIATPHIFHYQYIKQALLAGKHVFAEKAITVSAAQFDEVQALAQEKGLILTEGLTLLHMPLYDEVHKLIADGKIGQVKLVQVNFGSLKDVDLGNRFFNKKLAGGALYDIGGYATAFARTFLSDQPNVTLSSVKFFETGVDEMSGIVMKNANQQMAVMALSLRAKQPKRGVISGTKGYIEISNYPRATRAEITYTGDAHAETTATLTAGDSRDALIYEVRDMQRYVEMGHDEGQLSVSRDVSHLMDSIRNGWGLEF